MDDTVKALLTLSLNARDDFGKTPLMPAAWTGDLRSVTELPAAGADRRVEKRIGTGV